MNEPDIAELVVEHVMRSSQRAFAYAMKMAKIRAKVHKILEPEFNKITSSWLNKWREEGGEDGGFNLEGCCKEMEVLEDAYIEQHREELENE